MNMVLIGSDFQKLNFIAKRYVFADFFEFLINICRKYRFSIFRRTDYVEIVAKGINIYSMYRKEQVREILRKAGIQDNLIMLHDIKGLSINSLFKKTRISNNFIKLIGKQTAANFIKINHLDLK